MKWQWIAFILLYLYNIVYNFILRIKSTNTKHQEQNPENIRSSSHNTVIDYIVFYVSGLLFLSLYLFVFLNKILPWPVTIILFILPYILLRINNTLNASSTLKKIFIEDNDNIELTHEEKSNFDIIIGTYIGTIIYFISDKTIPFLEALSISSIFFEILLSLYILIIYFGFIYFVIVQLITPLRHLKILLVFVASKTKNIIAKTVNCLVEYDSESLYVSAHYSNQIITSLKDKNVIVKIFFILILPFAFLIDVCIGVFEFIYLICICNLLLMLFGLVRHVGKIILFMINKATNIPGRRMVKNTFRLTSIISILLLIVNLRFSLTYAFSDTFISISEFIASAVIIPVIFEWIYSNSKTPKSQKQETVS